MTCKHLLFILLLIGVAASSVRAEDHAKKAPPLSIGALLCLTGNCSDWGTAALRGAQLAIEELNARGGVLGRPLELRVEDTQESIGGARAVSAFQKMSKVDGLQFLIGPSWSPGALSVAPLAAKRKDLILITPSASAEEFSRAGSNLFNLRPAERLSTEALASFAIARDWRRLAVLGSSQPAESAQGGIFKAAAIGRGATITSYIETNPELPDVRTEALQTIASKPDAIFVIAYNQMLSAITNLRSQGFRGPILTISIDDARVASAPRLLEGMYVAKALPPTDDFINRFRAKFGEAPGLSAENGYDSVVAFAQAIEGLKSFDPPVVSEALGKLRFEGAAGPLAFSADRAVRQQPGLYQVSSGKLVRIFDAVAN